MEEDDDLRTSQKVENIFPVLITLLIICFQKRGYVRSGPRTLQFPDRMAKPTIELLLLVFKPLKQASL